MIQIGKLSKSLRKKLASYHVNDMITNYTEEIDQSINYSKIYTVDNLYGSVKTSGNNGFYTKISVTDNDTVTELFNMSEECDRIALLNFASYKHPGGMFYEGSSTQEEFLCHHSTLYPVLNNFRQAYYEPHKFSLNRSLYTNTGIYSCEILFFDYDSISVTDYNIRRYRCKGVTKADVITCAAPNVRAFNRFQRERLNKPDKEIDTLLYQTLYNRCELVLEMAKANDAHNLILGAFGCGVFGNKPEDVANIFAKLLFEKYAGAFKEVRFAIPVGENNVKFKEVLGII